MNTSSIGQGASNAGTVVRTGNARRPMAASSADGPMKANGNSTANSATGSAGTKNAIDNTAPNAAGKRARNCRSQEGTDDSSRKPDSSSL